MPLQRDYAIPADARQIAEIHMAAFGANAMLQATFPTPSVRAALHETIRAKAAADIQDPRITVLVVRESDTCTQQPHTVPRVVAFAKWSHPVRQGEDYTESPWVWPEGTDRAILDAWTNATEEAQERVLGGRPCYRLTFLGTDPAHEKRGAGSLLVRWGIDRSGEDGVPLYLESTLEAAPFDQNHGFVSREKVSVRMGGGGNCVPELYEEIIFIFEP
ncbi:putative GNAT family acetyltransferase [Sodiomyces alkalinus F11]|uniref:Putative GNAT family acetyltransferase n=1 Tax=Sodiomyces alkalinus (strain CBS 110278 / VKM F-3762 / F11) TaxID=1314773 RepID=A0A3N2PLC5_SODAK|nr:putative GNAT family acetyltransferase [Sodiomyces alkalinus F11]ROT35136.1 putative GNAT family acetyltransferase [Sodiomyces alkalinus F11]